MMANPPPVSITPGISMREYLLQLYPNLDDPHELAHFIRYHHGIADNYVAEGKYIEALKEYSLVLNCLSHFCHQHVEDIWKTHSNRSLCFYKLGQYSEALFSAESCITMAPQWHKGYWRAGMASKLCQGVEAALSYFVSGLAIIQKQNPEGNNDTVLFLVEIVTLILQVKETAVAEKTLGDLKLPDDPKVLSRIVQILANANNWEGVNLLVFGIHEYFSGPCSVLDGAAKGCTFELISVGSFLINVSDSEMDEWRIKLAVHMLKNGASIEEIGVRLKKPPVHVGIDVALKTGSVLLLKYLLEKFSAVPQQRDAIDSYGNGPYHIVIRSGRVHSTIGETVVNLLLNSGCRLDIPDALGKLPIQCLKLTDQIYQVMMNAASQSESKYCKLKLLVKNIDSQDKNDADAPITQEHINHARLCNALTTVCSNALREILLTNVPMPHPDIYKAILANKTKLKKLNKEQAPLVFPDPQGLSTGKVEEFDISLLYTIIRNVSSVPAPSNGWGKPPTDNPRDTTLGASVERIRTYRNHISGHSVDGKISQQEFEDYWVKIDEVLREIEIVIGNHGYLEDLEKRKNQAITPHEAHELQKTFQEYKKQTEAAASDIESTAETLMSIAKTLRGNQN